MPPPLIYVLLRCPALTAKTGTSYMRAGHAPRTSIPLKEVMMTNRRPRTPPQIHALNTRLDGLIETLKDAADEAARDPRFDESLPSELRQMRGDLVGFRRRVVKPLMKKKAVRSFGILRHIEDPGKPTDD